MISQIVHREMGRLDMQMSSLSGSVDALVGKMYDHMLNCYDS